MKKRIIILGIILLFIISLTSISYAASASISASSQNVTTGTSVTITGSVTAGGWNLKLSGNGESKNLIGYTQVADNSSASTSITFTPRSSGTYTFKLTGDITDFYSPDDKAENVDKSITITVSEPAPSEPTTPSTPAAPAPATSTKSSNANLSNLVVQPVDFTGFRASKTTGYSVTVGNDVTEVKIIPTLSDPKSKYAISGNKNLKEGTNIVKITVTAEDGTQKTYQVNVIRQVADGEITPNSIEDTTGISEDENNMGLSKLEVKGYELTPEFQTDVYKYTIKLEEAEIKTLEEFKELLITEVNFEGGTVEVLGPEEFNLEGENKILISVTDQEGREYAEYTIIIDYSPEIIEYDVEEQIEEDESKIKNMIINILNSKIFLIFLNAILFIIALIFIIKYRIQRKILKENGLLPIDDEYEYEENIEDKENIENDENENKIEKENEIEDDNKNYINELFESKQMNFDSTDKDYKRKRNRHGKH